MKQSTLVVTKKVERAQLGQWVCVPKGMTGTISSFIPYLKGREDIEILLRNRDLLDQGHPVELCGLSAHAMMSKAVSLEDTLREEFFTNPYLDFAKNHPVVVSFPSEFIWTGAVSGLAAFQDELNEGLPRTPLGIREDQCVEIANKLRALAEGSKKSQRFWDEVINNKYEQLPLTRVLIEWSIKSTMRCKARAMSGFVPIIDRTIPSSIINAHKINLAYGSALDNRTESNVPMYFYTLDFNPSMFKPDDVEALQKVVTNASMAMNMQMFDGICLHIRGLNMISRSPGRIHSAKWLIERLSDICDQEVLPLWWSNSNVAGLSGMDQGVSLASMRVNASTSDEIFFGGGGSSDEENKYGKILNVTMKDTWDVSQVRKAVAKDRGLTGFDNFPLDLSSINTSKAKQYRMDFSKPFNLAAICHLSKDWLRHIDQGEVKPGESYLKDFTPYGGWAE